MPTFCFSVPFARAILQVHDLMDDIQDQQEVAKEISEAISNPIGYNDVDEDDLLAELEELEQEVHCMFQSTL